MSSPPSPPATPTLPAGPYRRRTARVLLVNAKNELLLFEWPRRGLPGQTSWSTPGGGKGRFETPARAAARELREETGLRISAKKLGPPVAATGGWADLGFAQGIFRDDFFFHRVDHHEVDLTRGLEYERKTIVSIRWWTLDELAGSEARIVPFGLVPLLTELFAGQRPDRLVILPWHHDQPHREPAG